MRKHKKGFRFFGALLVEKVKNFSKIFVVFRKNYKPVPLEVFAKDPYKTLVSTLLSSRTRDETTLRASKRLFKKAPNVKILSEFKYLTRTVLVKCGGRIPNTREELMKLPGVGRKTANLVLNRAFGKPAIAVDTHVHRISNMLGWVKTKNPQATEKALVKILPKKYWSDINRLFVSIGRQYRSRQKLIKFLKKSRLFMSPEQL